MSGSVGIRKAAPSWRAEVARHLARCVTGLVRLGPIAVLALGLLGFPQAVSAQDSWTSLGMDRVVHRLAVDERTGRLYAYGAIGRERPTSGTLYWTDDRGSTWATAPVVEVGSGFVAGVGINDGGEIFIPDLVQVRISSDGGQTWRNSAPVRGSSAMALVPGTPPVLYVVTGPIFSKSFDAGSSWETVRLPESGCSQETIVVNPLDSAMIFVGGGCGLFRSEDGGETWTNVLPLYATYPALSKGGSLTLFVVTPKNGFWVSNDLGDSWANINPDFKSTLLMADPRDPGGRAGTDCVDRSGSILEF